VTGRLDRDNRSGLSQRETSPRLREPGDGVLSSRHRGAAIARRSGCASSRGRPSDGRAEEAIDLLAERLAGQAVAEFEFDQADEQRIQ
jgi:hypothetical protein